jgi:hypothetical protein
MTISDSDSPAVDVAPADDAIEGVGTILVCDVPAVEDEQARGGDLLMADGPVSGADQSFPSAVPDELPSLESHEPAPLEGLMGSLVSSIHGAIASPVEVRDSIAPSGPAPGEDDAFAYGGTSDQSKKGGGGFIDRFLGQGESEPVDGMTVSDSHPADAPPLAA